MSYKAVAAPREDRYGVTVDAYRQYQRDGFYIARDLLSGDEVNRMLDHGMDLLEGRVTPDGVEPPPSDATPADLHARFARIHMLHRSDAMHEQYLLHPRALDVLEALIGPDVLALQTMYFFNQPGEGGQGWHQDAYYITTYPDTLIGAWMALDRAGTDNGCLWVAPGSHNEPIYPDAGRGALVHAERALSDVATVEAISSLDDEANSLTRVADAYGEPVPVELEPGDVVFSTVICCTGRTRTPRPTAGAAPSYATTRTPGRGRRGTTAGHTTATPRTTCIFWRAGKRTCHTAVPVAAS